jgi:hypothetical protein
MSDQAKHAPERPEWRHGTKVHLNVYEGDRPVCQCHTVQDAALIIAAVNGYPVFVAEVRNVLDGSAKHAPERPEGLDEFLDCDICPHKWHGVTKVKLATYIRNLEASAKETAGELERVTDKLRLELWGHHETTAELGRLKAENERFRAVLNDAGFDDEVVAKIAEERDRLRETNRELVEALEATICTCIEQETKLPWDKIHPSNYSGQPAGWAVRVYCKRCLALARAKSQT